MEHEAGEIFTSDEVISVPERGVIAIFYHLASNDMEVETNLPLVYVRQAVRDLGKTIDEALDEDDLSVSISYNGETVITTVLEEDEEF